MMKEEFMFPILIVLSLSPSTPTAFFLPSLLMAEMISLSVKGVNVDELPDVGRWSLLIIE
jgi:hypothetical protein